MALFQQDVINGNESLYMQLLGGQEYIFTGLWPNKVI